VAIYVVLLAGLAELVAFPLNLYAGYVLERRYGLATGRGASWLRLHLKGGALSLAFATAGAVLLYVAVARWPATWWLIAGTGFSLIAIVFANLAPVLLLPLFYRCTPLDRDALNRRLLDLAARARVPAMGVYRWRLSDRTRKGNAALAGLGRTRRILVSDTLLDAYSEDEVGVMFAHEIGHHVHRDIWRGIAYESAMALAGCFLADRALRAFAPAARLTSLHDVAGLPLVALAAGALSLVGLPIANAVSRAHERRADGFALALTGNPSAFVSAMRRLGAQNLAEESPSRLVRALFHSHPPIDERLEAARAWERGHSPPGDQPSTLSG
jgi:STE24 endopeptidase